MATSREQAELLDRVVAEMKFGGYTDLQAQALFVPALPEKGLPAGDGEKNPSFADFDKKHPEGAWKLFVGKLDVHSVQDPKPQNLASLIALSGKLGDGPLKVALIYQKQLINLGAAFWPMAGTAQAIRDVGIEIVADDSGCFVPNLPSEHLDLGISSDRISTHYVVVSHKAAKQIEEAVLERNAGQQACRLLSSHVCRDPQRASAAKIAESLSLGAFSYPDLNFPERPRHAGLESCCLPPQDYPVYSLIDGAERICALESAWNRYLESYGMRLTSEYSRDMLEALANEDMRSFVAEISSGKIPVHGKTAVLAIEKRASEIGQGYGDIGLGFVESDSVGASWPFESRRDALPSPHDGKGPMANVSKALVGIDAFLLDLERRLFSKEQKACAVSRFAITLDNAFAEHFIHLSSFPEISNIEKWGLVLVNIERANIFKIQSALYVSVAAGWHKDDIDGIVAVAADFSKMDPGGIREVLAPALENGSKIIADWGLGLAGRHLESIADKATRQSCGAEDRFILKSREHVDDEVFLKIEEAGRHSALSGALVDLSRVAGYDPGLAKAKVEVLSNGKISLPIEKICYKQNRKESFEEKWALPALLPVHEFFAQSDDYGISAACDVCSIWNTVLYENGFIFGHDFPFGVDPEHFEKLKKAIGIDSYLDAYFAGVPVEDIIDADRQRR